MLVVLFVGVPMPASAQHSQGYFIFSVIFCCLLHLCVLRFCYCSVLATLCLPHCAYPTVHRLLHCALHAALCLACPTIHRLPHSIKLDPLCLTISTIPYLYQCFLLFLSCPTVPCSPLLLLFPTPFHLLRCCLNSSNCRRSGTAATDVAASFIFRRQIAAADAAQIFQG